MHASSLFGKLLRDLREQAGLSQSKLAANLNLKRSTISRIETGSQNPPLVSAFYEGLRAVPEFSDEDITLLLEARDAEESLKDLRKPSGPIAGEDAVLIDLVQKIIIRQINYGKLAANSLITTEDSGTTVEEESQNTLTQSFTETSVDAIISAPMKPEKGEGVGDIPTLPPEPQQQGDPDIAQGTNLPERVLEQPSRRERTRKPASRERVGKRQGVVYERELAQYRREYLQESAEPLSALLVDTVKNNDDPLSPIAEDALRLFTKAALKAKAMTLNKASQELHISVQSLSDFVRKGLIPPLYKNKGATYLAKTTAEELGRDLEDAREMGMQPARLLRERHDKYFPPATK